MGKFRSKLKGQRKGKRWPKGQSSSSNPESRKYRDQAKSRFFQENLGQCNLTLDALRKHDEIQTFNTPSNQNSRDVDTESNCSTFRTMDTFASCWSECSNTSFDKLMKIFRTDSILHKEMLAILAAVTEVIKSKGGSESSTEYYAALMTTLEITETEESLSAVLSLLSMGIKSVPRSVLQTQFSSASKIFLEILSKFSQLNNNIILKSSLNCLSILLRSQEVISWSNPSTVHVFDFVLSFITHSKPKVRKTAQRAVCSILKGSYFMLCNENEIEKPAVSHPISGYVATYCVKQIENLTGSPSGETTTLHILSLLKEIIDTFQKSHLKTVCETILKIMTLNNALVSSCSFQVLHSLFSKQVSTVSADLNAQLISALYDYQPASGDTELSLQWVVVMQQSHVHLADNDTSLCIMLMPRIIQTLTQLLITERTETINAVTIALEAIIRDCIGPICETKECSEKYTSILTQCFSVLEQGLGYQYHESWKHVLHLLAVMFEVAGKTCSELLIKPLKSLAELRDSYKFSYNNELERAVGAAVRSMGPHVVLSTISLTKSNNEINLDRSWLLPVLKDNIQNSTLEYFHQYILPLATVCYNKAIILKTSHDGVGSHSMELLSIQLWSLLPSFCNSPTDIKISFKTLAKTLGTVISESKDLRLSVMAALRKLIIKSKENDNHDDIAEIARFAKNYLPILFNIYTTKANGSEEEGQRLAALDTVKIYLTITPEELCKELYKSALNRLNNSENAFIRESIFDLIRILAIYQNHDVLNDLFSEYINKLPTNKNHKEQKKMYRLLEDLCGNDNKECKIFLSENQKNIQKLLIKSLDTTAVSSKGARLRCLNLIIKSMPYIDGNSHLVHSALAESITCMKDINERCRSTAKIVLITIGEKLIASNQTELYLSSMLGGLVGTPEMISATILALTTAVENFTGIFGINSLQLMLENVCQLLACDTRDIVLSCIYFIKMYIKSLPSPHVASSLPVIVSSITSMNSDCQGHFRIRIRNIFHRLIKKYGWTTIDDLVPSEDILTHRRLKNLNKLISRKKRSTEVEDNDSDDALFTINTKSKTIEEILADSDSEEERAEKTQDNSKKKMNTWLQEKEDDIIDFTDVSAIKKIRATNPSKTLVQSQSEKIKERGFKTASDGRLIIVDNSDDSDSDTKKLNKLNFDSDSSDDEKSTSGTLKTSAKRKYSSTASIINTGNNKRTMKYCAGGSGIHRNTLSDMGSEYRSKKAEGDIKKKGKVDPYAYLPLMRNTLNKRKRLKNAGQFKNIVKRANTVKGLKKRSGKTVQSNKKK